MPRGLTLIVVAVLLLGCTAAPTNAGAPVSFDAARAFLARIVDAVQSGNLAAVCQIADGGDGNCDNELLNAPRGTAPHIPPTVVGFRTIDNVTEGSRRQLGGTVLMLCGIDGANQPYRSEMLVFESGHGLQAINGPYWLGITIADSTNPVTPAEPAPTGGC